MSEEVWNGYRIRILKAVDAIKPKVGTMSAEHPTTFSVGVTSGATVLQDVLEIDGKPVPVLKTTAGYNIAYLPAYETVEEAARAYVETQGAKP